MLIFIEGEDYPIEALNDAFDDTKFYTQNGLVGIITSVGYYRSTEKNNLVFLLPKVFMADSNETIFGLTKSQIINLEIMGSFAHETTLNWIRQLSVHFYNSLLEYRRRRYNSSIIHQVEVFELNTNIAENEFSYLDLYLSIINFYKKNRNIILYKHIEFISNQVRKPKWEKTIRKSLPLILNKKPIYSEISNKKKSVDREEELITYFLSIVNHFINEHQLNISIDKTYILIRDNAFEALCKSGLKKLRKIKYRYFSDVLKRMYHLCEIFFTYHNSSTVKKKRDEFLAVSNYNVVFEDMVDKLFTKDNYNIENYDGISIEKLKNNSDGKILDHIYKYKSIIDTGDIFYIGDSKYYKSGHTAAKLSKYKQHTYAKNIIQFNIDLLNENKSYPNIRYRDELTDGYNITPNFFIYGYIKDVNNYTDHDITIMDATVSSFHFNQRLFDRDTLFVHQYKINFLFVLKAYTTFNTSRAEIFRREVKEKFRCHFIKYFSDKNKCRFEFHEFKETINKDSFIVEHFRVLSGKCYNTLSNKFILAKHLEDNSINENILSFFQRIDDFDTYFN